MRGRREGHVRHPRHRSGELRRMRQRLRPARPCHRRLCDGGLRHRPVRHGMGRLRHGHVQRLRDGAPVQRRPLRSMRKRLHPDDPLQVGMVRGVPVEAACQARPRDGTCARIVGGGGISTGTASSTSPRRTTARAAARGTRYHRERAARRRLLALSGLAFRPARRPLVRWRPRGPSTRGLRHTRRKNAETPDTFRRPGSRVPRSWCLVARGEFDRSLHSATPTKSLFPTALSCRSRGAEGRCPRRGGEGHRELQP